MAKVSYRSGEDPEVQAHAAGDAVRLRLDRGDVEELLRASEEGTVTLAFPRAELGDALSSGDPDVEAHARRRV